jgi:ferredoxin-type protein NapH
MISDSKKHLQNRLVFFLVGMVLFVAPFAIILTTVGYVLPAAGINAGAVAAQSEPSVHRAMCLRMPLDWAVWEHERFISRIVGNPLYALVFVLIAFSVFAGPLFCGWLCPGMLTEHLSRLIPDKLKIDLKGAVDPAPVRYGFLVGFFVMAAPFVNKSVCCSYCNWTWIEDSWSALFGKTDGVTGGALFAFSSSSIITFLLTFGLLGIFMKGGRGWCNFMCPAGALQNLAHWLGSKLRFTYKLRLKKERCTDCFECVSACPTWALAPSQDSVAINRHVCNGCKDCLAVCPTGALTYSRREPW